MTDLKAECQKLVDLVYAVRDIDLEALREDYKYRDNVQSLLDPTQWIKDEKAITVYRIIVLAAIQFREAVSDVPFQPQKTPLE